MTCLYVPSVMTPCSFLRLPHLHSFVAQDRAGTLQEILRREDCCVQGVGNCQLQIAHGVFQLINTNHQQNAGSVKQGVAFIWPKFYVKASVENVLIQAQSYLFSC